MSNSYTQIHLQIIFGVKYRQALITNDWEEKLFKYIAGIVNENRHKLIIVNGVEDHIHILIGMRPHQSVSDLLQDLKGSSSKWINENNFTRKKFEWQGGYGAFSYSKSSLPNVINYIANQKDHHKKITFLNEYRAFLKAFEIEYDERYILKDLI
jgi:putative transposase